MPGRGGIAPPGGIPGGDIGGFAAGGMGGGIGIAETGGAIGW